MSTYTDTIRRYAVDDRYVGTLEHADAVGEVGLGSGEAGSRLAVRFALRLRAGRAEAVRFQVFGCGFTVAACAAAAELADGKTLQEIAALTPAMIDRRLDGLPRERDYCAQLAIDALQAAVQSAGHGGAIEQVTAAERDDTVAHLDANDPLYRALLATPAPSGCDPADRTLFAGLIAIACRDSADPAAAIGLTAAEFVLLRDSCFPGIDRSQLCGRAKRQPQTATTDLRNLLDGYFPNAPSPLTHFFALALAARAACPGHLWVAMGLQERPQLSAAIARHLPALHAANDRNMRWKRFFFKQLCTQSGGTLCKTPDCGVCSDYALCFAPEP